MPSVIHFLKLVRWNNLFIIAISMASVWFFVNHRYLIQEEMHLNAPWIALLILGTVLIAAGGYIINDYFDIKIDAVNRPDTLIISNQITGRQAQISHIILSIIGLIMNIGVAIHIGNIFLGLITIGSIVLLWFYSTHFKRMSIIGNVLVALLTAISIAQLFFFEPGLYPYIHDGFIISSGRVNPILLILGISAFAFMLNWMREVIKDMEDIKGDTEEGCRTYPIVYGLKAATTFVLRIGFCAILFLVIAVIYLFLHSKYISGTLALIPIAHLIWTMYLLPMKGSSRHYAMISRMMKIIMLEGLLLIIFLGN